MKNYILIVFLLLSTNSFTQKKDITGTYFMTYGYKGYQGCCKVNEILQLNNDHTFQLYSNDDQGDYQSEGITFGKFNIKSDTIFFLSQTPYPSKNIECLPFNDSIGDKFFRITFFDSFNRGIVEFIDNDYFNVDDSLKITPIKVIKTSPDIHTLLDTSYGQIQFKYQEHPLRTFQVYLEKPTTSNLMIVRKNVFQYMPGFTLTKDFLHTNDIAINLNMGIRSLFFDYSGHQLKIEKNVISVLKVNVIRAGTQYDANYVYEKMNANDFDSLVIQVSEFDSLMKIENIIIKKDKSVKFNYDYYNPKLKLDNKGEKTIHITNEKCNQLFKMILEHPIYEIGEKNNLGKRQISHIDIYFKNAHFENGGDLLSNKLYQFLFKELIDKE